MTEKLADIGTTVYSVQSLHTEINTAANSRRNVT